MVQEMATQSISDAKREVRHTKTGRCRGLDIPVHLFVYTPFLTTSSSHESYRRSPSLYTSRLKTMSRQPMEKESTFLDGRESLSLRDRSRKDERDEV